MNKTVRDFGLGVTTAVGLWGASALVPIEQVVGEPRSSQWSKVRAEHLRTHPVCEACGQKDNLNVHHVVPFHNDPSKELDLENLITLCTDGPMNINCHGLLGHGGNYKCRNPHVRDDVKKFREILSHKLCSPR